MDTEPNSSSDYHLVNRPLRKERLSCQGIVEDLRDSSVSVTKSSSCEADFLKRWANNETKQKPTPAEQLVKIELDVAYALAEFSRLVCLPSQPSEEPVFNLQWCRKKKRSTRSCKLDPVSLFASSKHKLKLQTTAKVQSNDRCTSHLDVHKCKEFLDETTRKLDSLLAGETDIHNSRSTPELSKESIPSGSGAESPSSPLPPQLECALAHAGPVSAFQRVFLPAHSVLKPATLSVKQEVESMCCDIEQSRNTQGFRTVVKRSTRYSHVAPSLTVLKAIITADNHTPGKCGMSCSESSNKEVKADSFTQARAEESMFDLYPLAEERNHRLMKRYKPTLTEMEKEIRRLQRVQANRESARQTIRKKQVKCEELTKKAARLKTENARMVHEKELLFQEFSVLSERNQQLKQMLQSESDSPQSSLPKSNIVPLQQVKLHPQVPMQQNFGMASRESHNPETCDSSIVRTGKNENCQQIAPHIPFNVGNFAVVRSKPPNSLAEGNACKELAEKELVDNAMLVHNDGEEGAPGIQTETRGSEDALMKFSLCQNLKTRCQTKSYLTTQSSYSKVVGKELLEYQTRQFHMQNPGSNYCSGMTLQLSRSQGSQHLKVIDEESQYTNLLIQQKAAAAAEARRRRKEITRSKVLRPRQLRLPY